MSIMPFKVKNITYFLGRIIAMTIARSMYRIRIEGRENIPKDEAVVFVCNHVTLLDWLILSVIIKQKVRFVMTYRIWKIPVFGLFFRIFDAIPIASKNENEELMEKAFKTIRKSLLNGESIFIFPEGMLTRDGNLLPFKKGIDRILDETPVRVIPCSLHGMWGSFFAHKNARPFAKPFYKRILSKIKIKIGEPIFPENASSENLQKIIERMINDNP